MRKPLYILICLVLMTGAVACQKNDERSANATENNGNHSEIDSSQDTSLAPDFSLPDLEGNIIGPASFRGKVLIIDFWATWCPPCVKAVPHLTSMKEKYGPQGFEVIGVSLDTGSDAEMLVKAFAEEMGVNYPMVIGSGDVADDYGGITGIPTLFIINKEGQIVKSQTGYSPDIGKMTETEVEKLLAE